MRTSADEVSIHALSPESTFATSSARASEASASTAASASVERTHQYPVPKDRCLLSIVPPRSKKSMSNGGATTRRRGSTGYRRARARNQGHRCPVSGHSLLFVQRQPRLGAGAQPPEVVAVPERDEGGHDEGRGQDRLGIGEEHDQERRRERRQHGGERDVAREPDDQDEDRRRAAAASGASVRRTPSAVGHALAAREAERHRKEVAQERR